jgi:ankyrin repeat protein
VKKAHLLIKKGADVNIQNRNNETALDIAIRKQE